MNAGRRMAITLAWMAAGSLWAQNLIVNGGFDDRENPLRGWHHDYAWTRNKHYEGNASRVSVVPQEAGQRGVLQIREFGDAGSKAESMLIPFEQGATYRARLKVKGGPYRIYFAGYQWTPGIRPHGDPGIEEMRQLYRSKAAAGSAPSWKTITLEIPGVDASELSLRHLSKVRFITLYLWFLKTGFVDDVEITRVGTASPGMRRSP